MQTILIIQTAFIGDVVLATTLVEDLKRACTATSIDFLVRKGNETLLQNNPNIREVLTWDKRKQKLRNLFRLLHQIRSQHYDLVINLQRYFSTGLLTAFSGAKATVGFDKNPLSFLFSNRVAHKFDTSNPRHEIERNNDLIVQLTGGKPGKPVLYPSAADHELAKSFSPSSYITITPSSVWFTKKYPIEKWMDLIGRLPKHITVLLLGGKENRDEAEAIKLHCRDSPIKVLAGQLSFLQSAALMKSALMNYTNDSAPLHFASAMNAPVTAVFCSTVPEFGYTPLSDQSYIVETKVALSCRPCGLHGYKSCPLAHFNCAYTIETEQLLSTLPEC